MTENHPITPPPELVNLWMSEDAPWDSDSFGVLTARPSQLRHIATQAANWGADTELDACCSWADATGWCGAGDMLRAARRSKPPSLKERALAELDLLKADATTYGLGFDAPDIRRALEALPE